VRGRRVVIRSMVVHLFKKVGGRSQTRETRDRGITETLQQNKRGEVQGPRTMVPNRYFCNNRVPRGPIQRVDRTPTGAERTQ
jgi:hypothetical protein